MKRCIKCNKEKSEDEFYANWSHWCNDCISKSKRNMEYKKFIRNGGIDGKENLLFATYGLAKEGLDIPRLDRLILASPHRDKATVIQAVGRIERKFENKVKPICYDLVDPIQYFRNMYSNRKSYYRKNNNKIEEN